MENSRSKTALDTKALFYFNYMHNFNVKHAVHCQTPWKTAAATNHRNIDFIPYYLSRQS